MHTRAIRTLAFFILCLATSLAVPSAVTADEDSLLAPEQYVVTEPTLPLDEEPPLANPNDQMSVYAINLGNENVGDAVIVECGSDLLLMDLGNRGAFDRVAQALDELGAPRKNAGESERHLSLYFSHYHSDHTGGIGATGSVQQLLNTYKVDTVYLPDISIFAGRIDGSAYLERGDRIRALAQEKQNGCTIVSLQQGSTFNIGKAHAVVIGPVGVEGFTDPGNEPLPTEDENKDDYAWGEFVNNCSLVTRITFGNVSYLTPGDAKEEADAALIEAYGTDLHADILKLPHHALRSNTEALLSYVQPTYSFATNNGYTGLQNDKASGLDKRITYSEKQQASAYGMCYMIGEEDDGLVFKTNGTSKLCYRYSDQDTPLAGGIVRTAGSYGQERGAGPYDIYDYYYLDETGSPVSGIHNVRINGVEGYRMFDHGGKLCLGQWIVQNGKPKYRGWITYENGDKQYIYRNTAIIARGFADINGKTYYFDPSNDCHMAKGLQLIGEYYYQFLDSGELIRSSWYNDADNSNDHWMYFGKDGTRISGWMTLDGAKYYLDASTGYRATGAKKIGAHYFQFDDEGRMLSSCWHDNRYYLKNGQRASGLTAIEGNKYYLDPLTGYRTVGLKKIGEYYYYFRKTNGHALKNVSVSIDGYKCTFDKYGIWTNPPRVARPTLLGVEVIDSSTLQPTWQKQDVDGYEIFRSTKEDGEFRRLLAVKDANATSYAISSLKSHKTYYFKIRSYKSVLGLKVYSSFSDVIGATTL